MGTKNAKEYREKLTGMFMDLLNDSLDHPVNWRQGWGAALTQAPYNAARGTRYRGINRFYLSMVACREGFDDPRWATPTLGNDVPDQEEQLAPAEGLQGIRGRVLVPL